MDASKLARCTGARLDRAQLFAEPLSNAMELFEISTPIRQAMFLANIGHESAGLTTLAENLNYSVTALLSLFGRHRISVSDAERFGRGPGQVANQEAIANAIYGGQFGRVNLGNVEPGDGWRFRGRGPKQITGRGNYTAFRDHLAKLMGSIPDFAEDPELLEDRVWGSMAAGDYWKQRRLNSWADVGDFDGVCDVINLGHKTRPIGDSIGFSSREKLYAAARVALGVK